MSDYTFIILAQSAAVLTWMFLVKRQKREVPHFDSWLFSRMQGESGVTMDEAFNEYIRNYNIRFGNGSEEPSIISRARTKLQLIDEYDLDEIYKGNEVYKNYKLKLKKTVNLIPQAVYLN